MENYDWDINKKIQIQGGEVYYDPFLFILILLDQRWLL